MGRRSRRRLPGPHAHDGAAPAAVRRSLLEEVNRSPRGRPRPEPPWGRFPLSEIVILAGLVIVGVAVLAERSAAALLAGIALVVLGVGEVVVREHSSGFRSHALLLAFLPIVALQTAVVLLTRDPTVAAAAPIAEIPLFVGLFVLLRRSFRRARDRPAPAVRRPSEA